jgi:DnaK suppressor protein
MTTTVGNSMNDTKARGLVADERARIEAALADLDAAALAEADLLSQQAGDASESGSAVAAAVARTIGDGLRGRLREAERAEQRIEAGTYGLSVDSGARIPSARLMADPLAERTVEEQAELDRARRAVRASSVGRQQVARQELTQ